MCIRDSFTLTVYGATPGQDVILVRSAYRGANACPDMFHGICVDIEPIRQIAVLTADEDGSVTWTQTVPRLEEGEWWHFQALTIDGYGAVSDVESRQVEWPVEPSCGDGMVQADEACDDGNTDDFDGCSSACAFEYCGDGVVQPDEECDDAGVVDFDGCSEGCLFEYCGDGVLQPSEECDDGAMVDMDGCSAVCAFEICGDGVVHPWELCDDGNAEDFEGCLS